MRSTAINCLVPPRRRYLPFNCSEADERLRRAIKPCDQPGQRTNCTSASRNCRATPRRLHPDFFEFGGSSTVWNRQQTVDRLAQELPIERSLTDLSMRSLAADVMLVTYRAVGRDLAGGKEWHSLRSSIWKLTDGRWQVILHQGTPTQAAPP
jgi:hypothetical protein